MGESNCTSPLIKGVFFELSKNQHGAATTRTKNNVRLAEIISLNLGKKKTLAGESNF